MAIDLIGGPFDRYGRPNNQARAAAAFAGRKLLAERDFDLPEQTGERAAGSGLMNEKALLAMTDALHAQVGAALAAN